MSLYSSLSSYAEIDLKFVNLPRYKQLPTINIIKSPVKGKMVYDVNSCSNLNINYIRKE